MDFEDTPAEAAFRKEARAWLAEHAPPRSDGGSPISLFEHQDPAAELSWVSACRAWQRVKHADGWSAITWPVAWGGRDGTPMQQIIFNEEEAATGAPSSAFGITLGMIAPTILAHGTDEQRRHLPRMLGGEELWCQLFSEPGAGSDLAGMRTRADRDGDE